MIGAAAAGWLLAAWLLWRTSVPDLDLVGVDPETVFGEGYLDSSARYERFLRTTWAIATLVQIGVLIAAARLAPRFRQRGIRGGVAIGSATLVAVWLATLPVVLANHWWRRRYGVSDAGYSTILVDPWLERIGSLAAAAGAIALFMLLARRLGDRWWLVGGPVFAVVAATFLLTQPLLLAPRLEPLRDPALAAEIRELARHQGVGEVEIVVRDASRRTHAINAEFYGLGPTKRVVIWDTALLSLVEPEIRVLVSHEFGHDQAHHVWKSVGWIFLFALPGAYVVARATRRRGGLGRPAAVPVALLAITLLQLALLPAVTGISRRYEREADWLAMEATRDNVAFEELTGKLAGAALADPDPPQWAKLVLETHPTPLERIELARTLRRAAGLPGGS